MTDYDPIEVEVEEEVAVVDVTAALRRRGWRRRSRVDTAAVVLEIRRQEEAAELIDVRCPVLCTVAHPCAKPYGHTPDLHHYCTACDVTYGEGIPR